MTEKEFIDKWKWQKGEGFGSAMFDFSSSLKVDLDKLKLELQKTMSKEPTPKTDTCCAGIYFELNPVEGAAWLRTWANIKTLNELEDKSDIITIFNNCPVCGAPIDNKDLLKEKSTISVSIIEHLGGAGG